MNKYNELLKKLEGFNVNNTTWGNTSNSVKAWICAIIEGKHTPEQIISTLDRKNNWNDVFEALEHINTLNERVLKEFSNLDDLRVFLEENQENVGNWWNEVGQESYKVYLYKYDIRNGKRMEQ